MSAPTEAGLIQLARRYGPARPLTPREAWYVDSALRAYGSARGPTKELIGNWIVAFAKKMRGWPSPYRFFRRTNVRHNWTIVSYHHRAQLCWEWCLSARIGKATCGRSANPRNWLRHYGGQFALGIPFVFEVHLSTQKSGWMVSGDALNMLRFLCEHHHAEREAA